MDGYIADLVVQEKRPKLEIKYTMVNVNPSMLFFYTKYRQVCAQSM